jgi:hypothetical protein
LPDFFAEANHKSMAAHSPSMKVVFQNYMPTVEKAFLDRQHDCALWRMWLQMTQIVGVGSRLYDFLRLFPELPPMSGLDWPPIAISEWQVEEARATGDWSKITASKWPEWRSIQYELDLFAPIYAVPEGKLEEVSLQRWRDLHT